MSRAPDRPWRQPEKISDVPRCLGILTPKHEKFVEFFMQATKIGDFFGHGFTGDSTTQEENRK